MKYVPVHPLASSLPDTTRPVWDQDLATAIGEVTLFMLVLPAIIVGVIIHLWRARRALHIERG